MLATIVKNSVLLVKFIALLNLSLRPAPLQHLTNVADALIVASERRKKSLSALNRCLVEPPTDEYALADCFRASPWQAEGVRAKLLQFLVPHAVALAAKLNLDKVIYLSLDDSLCEKDPNTKHLQAVDWHHDHNARAKKQASFKNGSVYVLCRLQIGFIEFTVNWRLYLREQTVKRLNRGRAKTDRLTFRSKLDLAQAMLAEVQPYLPADWPVYVLFDSWYASKDLIRFIRQQGWQVIGGLKANRTLNGQQLKRWFAQQRPTSAKRLQVPTADGTRQTYWVYVLPGRLNEVPGEVCVLISRRHPRDKHPAYFFTTDRALVPTRVLEKYGHRWGCDAERTTSI